MKDFSSLTLFGVGSRDSDDVFAQYTSVGTTNEDEAGV